jgi:hypothetical protein
MAKGSKSSPKLSQSISLSLSMSWAVAGKEERIFSTSLLSQPVARKQRSLLSLFLFSHSQSVCVCFESFTKYPRYFG